MRDFRSSEVFKPGTFPEHTYVSRLSAESAYTYEFRLEQALNTAGFLTSIIGPSKTGKTVLCEKVIGIQNIVSLTGNDFTTKESFWITVAKKAGLSVEGEQIQYKTIEGEPIKGTTESKSSSLSERYLTNKDQVIEYFREQNLVLILDDFHYAPVELQYEMSYQLKDAIRKELKAIVISLPHRADDAIRKNPDLSGRLNLINIEPWQIPSLKEIAIKGFKMLGVTIDNDLASNLAKESLTSPQLMQSICLNLAMILNLDQTDEIQEITDRSLLEQAYKVTTLNLPYSDVAKRLKAGPPTRGQIRKTFGLVNGDKCDIYDLLLRAIAVDPPSISISLDDLKRRVDFLLGDTASKPDRNKIKKSIEQVQVIIENSDPMTKVFEWKDNEIYILDPLFLFDLRWGTH